jgi:hypothetical protein
MSVFFVGGRQAECIKFLYDRMRGLHGKFEMTENAAHFPRPIFHIMVLFVDEQIAVDRQLARGVKVLAHNEQVHVFVLRVNILSFAKFARRSRKSGRPWK